ncbi:MAG: hypothetical protein K9N21_17520 [Deltaproteobacteria bacterium]|nr:hypothetical protein [Deltaproteobacteria bacterium]
MERQLCYGWFHVVGLMGVLLAWIVLPLSMAWAEKPGTGYEEVLYIQSTDLRDTAPDVYEPDNSWTSSKVILLNDQKPHPEWSDYKPIQIHNFHKAGDEDWVRFFILEGEIYKVTVDSPGERCDAVIGIYDMDGQTLIKEIDDTFAGEKEYAEWECETSGTYYARIRQYDSQVYGEGTEYQLSLTQPYMAFNGFIRGTLTPPVDARVFTSYSSASAVNGEFFLPHIAGDYTLEVIAEGCIGYSVPLTVPELKDLIVDIDLDCPGESGALCVTLGPAEANNAGAGWRVDCGTWKESGAAVSGLAPGGHTLELKPLNGWYAPTEQTVNIVSGNTMDASISYRKSWEACLPVDKAMNISIPCVEYVGIRYGFTLSYRPDVCPGLCWKLGNLTPAGDGDCLAVGSDLSFPVSCAEYNGAQFQFVLDFYPNANDPSGLYWQMDPATFSFK